MTSALIIVRGPDGKTVSFIISHDGYPVDGVGDALRCFLAKACPAAGDSYVELAAQAGQALADASFASARWDGHNHYDWRYVIAYNPDVSAWTFTQIDWGPEQDALSYIEDVVQEDPEDSSAREDADWIKHCLLGSYDKLRQTPPRVEGAPILLSDTPDDINGL